MKRSNMLVSLGTPAQSLALLARTATANGSGVDVSNVNEVIVSLDVKNGITLSGTNKITVTLQESDDNSTFADVAAAEIKGGTGVVGQLIVLDADAKAIPALFGYLGTKKYIRGVATFAGTHGTGSPIAINVMLGAKGFSVV